jgi:hypothetical protein
MNPNSKHKDILKKFVKKPKIIFTTQEKQSEKIKTSSKPLADKYIKATEKKSKTQKDKSKKLILVPKSETTPQLKQEIKEIKKPTTMFDTEKSKDTIYNHNVNKNFENIPTIENNERVYVCMYRINEKGFKPFIEYCLLKYPKSENKYISDLCIFPYFKFKGTNVLNESNDFVKSITNNDYTSEGFIYFRNVFMIVNLV